MTEQEISRAADTALIAEEAVREMQKCCEEYADLRFLTERVNTALYHLIRVRNTLVANRGLRK